MDSNCVMDKILLIEDDKDIAAFIAASLKRHGFEAEIKTSLDSGARLLKNNGYSAVILDLGLPDATGFYALNKLISIFGDKFPIMVLTGSYDLGIRACANGASSQLTKPFVEEDLIAALASALGIHSTRKRMEPFEASTERAMVLIDKLCKVCGA